MKPIEARIADCLTFLEGIRPGYKYSITINKPIPMGDVLSVGMWKTTVSVIGECHKDKSYPHIFLTVNLTDFSKLPDAIHVEAQRLIFEEINTNQKAIADLVKSLDALFAKSVAVVELKSTLADPIRPEMEPCSKIE